MRTEERLRKNLFPVRSARKALFKIKKHLEESTMQNYTTQMDAARKGIVTPEMEIVAKK